MKPKPLSIIHAIAEHYLRDAQDFAARFDVLWENQMHKTGRIKSFVDLLMSCECAMKSHVALGRIADDPMVVYTTIRGLGHEIAQLATAATYLADRTSYDELAGRLQEFSVFVRYSLDAYETFFPTFIERHDAKIDYTKTIGNNNWVLETRSLLEPLLTTANKAFIGSVTNDVDVIFAHEHDWKEFMKEFQKNRKRKAAVMSSEA